MSISSTSSSRNAPDSRFLLTLAATGGGSFDSRPSSRGSAAAAAAERELLPVAPVSLSPARSKPRESSTSYRASYFSVISTRRQCASCTVRRPFHRHRSLSRRWLEDLELSALVEEVSDELTSSLFSSKSAAVARDELGRTSSGAVSVKFGESSMAAFFDGAPGL